MRKNILLLLSLSLLASSASEATVGTAQATSARNCTNALMNLGLPSAGNISLLWKTRDDLRAGPVSRTWNYYLRVSTCPSSNVKNCTTLTESNYIPGTNILAGRVDLELSAPIANLGCALAANPSHRGISIILVETGFIYNNYTTLHFIDFARLRDGSVEIDNSSTGLFSIYLR